MDAEQGVSGDANNLRKRHGKLLKFEFVTRWVIFLVYAALSMYALSLVRDRRKCFIQHTYRQEFVSNVVSNPLFSSSNLIQKAPVSAIEKNAYNGSEHVQTVSDIIMFPVLVHERYKDSAFLTVYPEPRAIEAADETIPLRQKLSGGAYYFDPASPNKISESNIQGVTPAERTSILHSMLWSARGSSKVDDGPAVHPGLQLPNLARCTQIMQGDKPDDSEKRLAELQTLLQNSHRMGTCLLTGQHATVDMMSNHATSMILFSSVNVMFIVAIVLWISASFALFHIGGWYKNWAEIQDADSDEAMKGKMAGTCWGCTSSCFCCGSFSLDDLFMLLAIAWNILPIILLMFSDFRQYHNVPLNNAILAISGLLCSIILQWGWANLHAFDVGLQEAVAGHVLMSGETHAGISAVQVPMPTSICASSVSTPTPTTAAQAVAQPCLSTANFLATASAVRDYGVQYAKAVAQMDHGMQNSTGMGVSNADGLRKRNNAGASHKFTSHDATMQERGYYAIPYGRNMERRSIISSSMPNYTALIRTGDPIAQYNYVNILKKEMFQDTVQGFEYAITTPMLFAALMAASSANVPTGMVQWAFVCLTGSHLLVVPLLYMSHIHATYRNNNKKKWEWEGLQISISFTLIACALLQAVGLTLCCKYTFDSYAYYGSMANLDQTAIGMASMQALFVITVVVSVILDLTIPKDASDASNPMNRDNVMYWVYTASNFSLRAALGCTLSMHAETKHFPVLTCNVWNGPWAG